MNKKHLGTLAHTLIEDKHLTAHAVLLMIISVILPLFLHYFLATLS